MIECGRQSAEDVSGSIRILKISVKAAKTCQEQDVLPLAQKVLERAAKYQADLSGKPPAGEEDKRTIGFLASEYFLARARLVS